MYIIYKKLTPELPKDDIVFAGMEVQNTFDEKRIYYKGLGVIGVILFMTEKYEDFRDYCDKLPGGSYEYSGTHTDSIVQVEYKPHVKIGN